MVIKRRRRVIFNYSNIFNQNFIYALVFGFIGLVLYFSMYSNVEPLKLNVTKFSTAEETIRAPITIEDEEATKRKQQEAINEVQPIYVLKHEYAQNQVDLVRSIFDAAIEVLDKVEQMTSDKQVSGEQLANHPRPTQSEIINMLKDNLTETVANSLSESTLNALVTSSRSDLIKARDAVVTAVNNVMSKRVSASSVEEGKRQAENEIRNHPLPTNLKNASIEIGRNAIVQNEYFDPEATELARQQTLEAVEPVRIFQGQIIVVEGQLITPEIYRQLDLLNLLDHEVQPLPYIGLALFVIVLVLFMFSFFTNNFRIEKHGDRKGLYIFAVIMVISVTFMKIISLIPISGMELSFVFPAALSTMLLKTLVKERFAILSAIILAACSTVIFNEYTSGTFNLTIGLYILFSGISGALLLTNQNHRSKILRAGLYVSLVNIMIICAILFMPNSQINNIQYLNYFLLAIGSGIGSAVLAIGFLPFFEATFGILSMIKLVELSNPNHPLLKKILTEAPGTYHHSIMVANLSEAACEAIGANGLLARVASYYHDIGKTRRPSFFIENQLNIDNPHDRLNPETSKDIITSHTIDGAKILADNKMPKEIIDIALQHHGTSFLKYFYHKAKENGMEVVEDDFRYAGPKPQTKEAAVINIADSVEAAVRSMSKPNMEKIEALVKNIIKDRLNDGQFTECNITIKELNIIEKTLCETLHGIFHNRIEYPE